MYLFLACYLLFVVSLFGKLFSVPGATVLVAMSLLLYVLSAIGLAIFRKVKKNKSVTGLLAIAPTVFVLGLFFKEMHWPGAAMILLAGAVVNLLIGLFQFSKHKDSNKKLCFMAMTSGFLGVYLCFSLLFWDFATMLALPVAASGILLLFARMSDKSYLSVGYVTFVSLWGASLFLVAVPNSTQFRFVNIDGYNTNNVPPGVFYYYAQFLYEEEKYEEAIGQVNNAIHQLENTENQFYPSDFDRERQMIIYTEARELISNKKWSQFKNPFN